MFFRLILLVLLVFSCRKPDNWVSLGSYCFSPNGDGINDLFILPFDTTNVNHMTIFDSYSKKEMFKVNQYHKTWWNGRKNNTGKLVPIGTYNYYLEIEGSFTYYGLVYVKY